MEALPNMPMMAPQFRTSTMSYDNIPNFNFRLRVKEYILLTFQADPHEYDEAFDELTQLKFEANIPSASVEQICKLKRYLGQLHMMQKRFPMGPGEALETPFTWHDGLVDMRNVQSEVTISDIEFEKASVMFNIGACHAQYAAEQPRDTQDSIKAAFMHFQYAAFAFEQLNTFRNSDVFYPSVDLDANVVSFYYKLLIAQAQECLVQKSLLDNRSPIVIAKLALWLQEAFDSAAKLVDEWCVNVPESIQKYYAKLCRLKSDIYGVIAYMSLGDQSEKEEKKMGWRLQYYNIAAQFMESVTMDRKMKEHYPELLVTASFLFDVISAKQKNAEKENDFIYHDRVPKREDAIDAAKKDGSMCKVKTLSFDPLDSSVCGEDLFGTLLPAVVLEANKKYEAQKAEILRENTEKVAAYDAQLVQMLEKADFNTLRFMLSEGNNAQMMFELPEELMKRNADMTAYPDCIPNLLERLRENSDTARVAEAKLNTLIAKLRAIDLPRLKADEGYVLIGKELDKLADHLAQAKTNNVSLNKAIASHSASLQLLSLPCHEMWQKLIPENEQRTKKTEMSKEEAQVRKMVDKIDEMRNQRHQIVEQLAADLKADDISKKLMGTNERGAAEVMNVEIQKHSNCQQLIRLNLAAQDAILRAFADANADFCDERMAMQSGRNVYEQRIGELIGAYEVYRDVVQKTDEGEQFYRQLMARCDQFAIPVHAMEEQYRAELEKKERAQKEAEMHMQKIRATRDAQNAMMDFGGAPASPMGPPMGPPIGRHPTLPPSASTNNGRAPRLGDYMESYRARKNAFHQEPAEEVPPAGPPSPTPSSICDFPTSTRSQRTMPSPRQFYQHQGPPPQQQHQYQGYNQPAPPVAQFQGFQPQYPNYPPVPHQGYQPATGPVPSPTPQYQQPAPVAQGPAPQYQQPPPQQYSPQPPLQYAQPSTVAQGPPPTQQYPPPSAALPVPPPTQQYSPQPSTVTQVPPPVPQYSQASVAATGLPQYPQPSTVAQVPPPTQQYVPPSAVAPAPLQYPPSSTVAQGPPQTSRFSQASTATPTPLQYSQPSAVTQVPHPNPQYQQPSAAAPALPQYSHPSTVAQAPPPAPQYPQAPAAAPVTQVPPTTPQYPAAPVPSQPSAAPVSQAASQPYQQRFQPTQQFIHQYPTPPASQTPPAQTRTSPSQPGPPVTNQTAHPQFTPTPGAPSPWHATPAQLKTPWNANSQYQSAQPPPPAAPTSAIPPQPSNVDLLSDLLGDFNLPPPIQPSVHNTQNLQSQPIRPDFRSIPVHPDPGKVIRPAAAVQPMPQMVQSATAVSAVETPILKNGSLSVTELVDPNKFELGEGNANKLEKRLLHHSIRTNGIPPPMNQTDPLNQIDAFRFAFPK